MLVQSNSKIKNMNVTYSGKQSSPIKSRSLLSRNKHGINVLLRDAVDDIDLIGWISPFTLLIHGSSEDMNTIEQAWVGRMLKPPQDFVIKDFGKHKCKLNKNI